MHSTQPPSTSSPSTSASSTSASSTFPSSTTTPKLRAGTKQATLVALMQRPGGATMNDLVEATGWQRHTVRSTISRSLKKRLGLNITMQKNNDQSLCYCIVPEGAVSTVSSEGLSESQPEPKAKVVDKKTKSFGLFSKMRFKS